MSISYKIDTEQFLVLVTITGVIQLDDLLELISTYPKNNHYQVGMNVLYDYRQGNLHLTGDDMILLVEHIRKIKGDSSYKIGMVATEDGTFGLGRMYSVYAEELAATSKIFRDMASCLEWINSPVQQS